MKITRLALIIMTTFLFLQISCKKDKDEKFYFKALVNGNSWEAANTETATSSTGEINGIIATASNGEIIGFRLTTPSAGTYTFRQSDATLVNFTVSSLGHEVYIEWETSEEINTSHFVIEQSADGLNWTSFHTEPAAGTAHSYQVMVTSTTGQHVKKYYRLKLVDTDNSFNYSTVTVVSSDYTAFFKPVSQNARTGYNGNLKITSNDKEKRIITGTFDFEAGPFPGTSPFYSITEGEFRVRY